MAGAQLARAQTQRPGRNTAHGLRAAGR